jgi:hypothetical protein
VLEAGHDAWWTGNPNLVTFSLEHVDPTSDNSTPLTDAQKAASFALIKDICTRWNIPMQPANSNGGITGHYSIDPQSRARCPGNYPWDELWDYLKGATHMPVPTGWKDDGTKLTSPNGHYAVKGFRQHILDAPAWDGSDVFLEDEQAVPQVELHNVNNPGARQLTRNRLLVYTQANGVQESACGLEIAECYKQITALKAQLVQLQGTASAQTIATLTAKLAQIAVIARV